MRGFLAVVLLVALSGCGADDAAGERPTRAATPSESTTATPSEPSAPTTEPPAEAGADDALAASVRAYSDAFLTGDVRTAYGLLTERCRAFTSVEELVASITEAAGLYGSALAFESYDATVDGEQARVSYTYAVSAIDRTDQPWVVEDGGWKLDDC